MSHQRSLLTNIIIMKKLDIVRITKCDMRREVSKCCWKNSPDRLAGHRVACGSFICRDWFHRPGPWVRLRHVYFRKLSQVILSRSHSFN